MSKKIALWGIDARGIFSIRKYLRLDQAERMVEDNSAEPVLHKQTGSIMALRLARPVPVEKLFTAKDAIAAPTIRFNDSKVRASCAVFSRAEVEAIVGMRGKSKTAALSEYQKAERIRWRRCAEDLVESAQQKLAVYTRVH